MNNLLKDFKIQPTKLRGENMSEKENIITEFIQIPTGFTLSECDLTSGKVIVNNIEITSVEDWEKVTKSIFELQQELKETKEMHKTMAKYALENEAKIDLLKTQQKEFINYLEDEINDIKEQIKNYDIWHEVGTDINFLILKKQFNEEILSKYKEIVGVEDVR